MLMLRLCICFRKLRQHREKKVKFEKEVDQYESKTSEIQKKMNEIKERLEALREQSTLLVIKTRFAFV